MAHNGTQIKQFRGEWARRTARGLRAALVLYAYHDTIARVVGCLAAELIAEILIIHLPSDIERGWARYNRRAGLIFKVAAVSSGDRSRS